MAIFVNAHRGMDFSLADRDNGGFSGNIGRVQTFVLQCLCRTATHPLQAVSQQQHRWHTDLLAPQLWLLLSSRTFSSYILDCKEE